MYFPRSRNTLLQRVDLVILILLELLDLHLVLQAEQERSPIRISLNLTRTLQQLVPQSVLIHIKKGSSPPALSTTATYATRCTPPSADKTCKRPPTLKPLTISRRSTRMSFQRLRRKDNSRLIRQLP